MEGQLCKSSYLEMTWATPTCIRTRSALGTNCWPLLCGTDVVPRRQCMPREENGGGKDRGYVQFMSSVILDAKEKGSERDMERGRELEALRQYKDTLGSLLTLSLASNPPWRDEHKVLSLLTFSTWCCLHCSIHFSKGLSWAAIHVLAHAVVGGPPRKDVKWLS